MLKDGRVYCCMQVLHAGIDVAANIVGVVALHLHAVAGAPGQDHVAETRGKPLDLSLDHV